MNGSSSVIGIGPGHSLQHRDNALTDNYCGSLQRPNNLSSARTNFYPTLQGTNAKTLPHNSQIINHLNNQTQPQSMYSFHSPSLPPNIEELDANERNVVNVSTLSQTPTPLPPVGTVKQIPTSKAMATTFSGMGTHV